MVFLGFIIKSNAVSISMARIKIDINQKRSPQKVTFFDLFIIEL